MVAERLMTMRELSDLLGVSMSTIYSWRCRGEGPAGYRVGKFVRFRRSDVEAWLERIAEPIGGR